MAVVDDAPVPAAGLGVLGDEPAGVVDARTRPTLTLTCTLSPISRQGTA